MLAALDFVYRFAVKGTRTDFAGFPTAWRAL
jgi:hypothetical protein